MSITGAQMDIAHTTDREQEALFSRLDLFLTLAFTAELMLNAYAHWIKSFLFDGWSIFDLVVVVLSLTGLAATGLPLRLVLLLRCCRIIRIFGKIPSVAKIFAALGRSLIPMSNAFFIIFVITAICE